MFKNRGGQVYPLVIRISNSSIPGKDYAKSFIDTEKALIVFNHYPLASLEGSWTSHEVIVF